MKALMRPLQSLKRAREDALRVLAEKVVTLIAAGTQGALETAQTILLEHYKQDREAALRAYERAFLVALKRINSRLKAGAANSNLISPHADMLALQAAVSVFHGKSALAFEQLRIATRTGAREAVCRRVCMDLIRSLPPQDNQTLLVYRGREVLSLAISRVPDCGLILVARTTPRYWQILNEVGLYPAPRDSVIILNREEILAKPGRLRAKGLNKRKNFDSLDWSGFFDALQDARAA